jgi:hypothetical protein
LSTEDFEQFVANRPARAAVGDQEAAPARASVMFSWAVNSEPNIAFDMDLWRRPPTPKEFKEANTEAYNYLVKLLNPAHSKNETRRFFLGKKNSGTDVIKKIYSKTAAASKAKAKVAVQEMKNLNLTPTKGVGHWMEEVSIRNNILKKNDSGLTSPELAGYLREAAERSGKYERILSNLDMGDQARLEEHDKSVTKFAQTLDRAETQAYAARLRRERDQKPPPRIRAVGDPDRNGAAAAATTVSPRSKILETMANTMAELAKGVQANSAALAKMASGKGRGAQKKSHEERIKSITCYGCGQKGHYKHTCENECTTCKDKLGAFYKDHIGKDCEFNRKNGFKSVKRVHVATPADTMMASAQDYFKSLMGEDDHEWCFGGPNNDDVEEKSRNIE